MYTEVNPEDLFNAFFGESLASKRQQRL
jgi:hypothetical protein